MRFRADGSSTIDMSKKKSAAAAIVFLLSDEDDQPKHKRTSWSKYWPQQKDTFSDVHLSRELEANSKDDYKKNLGMSSDSFQRLLTLVGPLISKRDTVMREAIPAEKRLIATLRFLATGGTLEDLKFSTAISPQALGKIIPETCDAIFQVLKDEYMKFPSNETEWEEVSKDFYQTWNFPNCGGAVDGRHIAIVKPPHSGSYYYNYKGFFSIILLALTNANYEFMIVNVGTNGHVSDCRALDNTLFNLNFEKNKIKLPDKSKTVNGFNFVFIGDEAFSLGEHFLKPFAVCELNPEKKVFNYRLSRARTVVENSFGIMSNRFRVLHTTMNFSPEKVVSVVKACCILHNYLRRNCKASYSPSTLLDQEDIKNGTVTAATWRNDSHATAFSKLQISPIRNYTDKAKMAREEYMSYFNGNGKVPWQDRMVDTGYCVA